MLLGVTCCSRRSDSLHRFAEAAHRYFTLDSTIKALAIQRDVKQGHPLGPLLLKTPCGRRTAAPLSFLNSAPLLRSFMATKLEAKPSKTSETQVNAKCNENMTRTCRDSAEDRQESSKNQPYKLQAKTLSALRNLRRDGVRQQTLKPKTLRTIEYRKHDENMPRFRRGSPGVLQEPAV